MPSFIQVDPIKGSIQVEDDGTLSVGTFVVKIVGTSGKASDFMLVTITVL